MPLAILLAVAGTSHFVAPGFYDRIVPRVLPGNARTYTYLSGACELACAAAVAHPRTRRWGGAAAAALFVAVFPANIQMAIDDRSVPSYVRLPLQVPLVAWALRVHRTAA